MGEIKYDFQKLEESTEMIAREKTHLEEFDKYSLDDLETILDSFHSDYATSLGYAVKNMKDIKAENLITELDEYSVCSKVAHDVMLEADEKLSDTYSKGEDK